MTRVSSRLTVSRARVLSHLTYANVVATLCLFIVVGGTSYAAIKVTGRNVVNNSLTGADIKNGSISGAPVDLGVKVIEGGR